jgi:hypothetical protein
VISRDCEIKGFGFSGRMRRFLKWLVMLFVAGGEIRSGQAEKKE